MQCLHNLLVSPTEEAILSAHYGTYQGLVLSSTACGKKKTQETDKETFERDIVEGFTQAKLLPRLRYMLEVCRPPKDVVILIMEVIMRLARHSLHCAGKVGPQWFCNNNNNYKLISSS